MNFFLAKRTCIREALADGTMTVCLGANHLSGWFRMANGGTNANGVCIENHILEVFFRICPKITTVGEENAVVVAVLKD